MMNNLRLLYTVLFGFFLGSCANKVAPQGGAIDSEPPILENAVPKSGTVDFGAEEIYLYFDEFVELKDPSQNIFVSPPLPKSPEFTALKKQIKIKLPDNIKQGITYTINFGNAIVDVHEGNVLTDFKYIFSTGSTLDSAKIIGTVLRADDLEPKENVIAVMYPQSIVDSSMFKVLPDYYSRVKEDGTFVIDNIKPGEYKIGAIEDNNSNYFAEFPGEWIAFLDTITSVSVANDVSLRLFPQASLISQPVNVKKYGDGLVNVAFMGNGRNFNMEMLNGSIIYQEWNHTSDTVVLYCNFLSDSIGVVFNNIELNDTLWSYRKQTSPEREKEKLFAVEIIRKSNDSISLVFNKPFNYSGSGDILINDSRTDYTIDYDYNNYAKKISFKKPDSTSLIVINNGTLRSFDNILNDTIKKEVVILTDRQSGILELDVQPFINYDTYIELINDRGAIFEKIKILKNKTYEISEIPPGSYVLKAFNDENKNGLWDSGNFYLQQQPETVRVYEQQLVIRANWSIQLDWSVN
jgi:Big-like domain-containing protein